MKNKSLTIFFLLAIFFVANLGFSQVTKLERMKALNFMVGDWVGSSTTLDNGDTINHVPAFQKIRYDLNKHIIVIDLRTELLQLHTVIHYSEKDSTYYYTPFSENGSRQLTASLNNGVFTVAANNTTRFVFKATKEGGFREYGEKLVDGEWVKYFIDNFTNTQD